ncbi:hypothetical protein MMC14_010161 [Varicellaria rhodocarpa]|nr:hypothetical protein [Varicellaria rhodocarpa]
MAENSIAITSANLATLNSLPNELLARVAYFASLKDLTKLARVNSRLYYAATYEIRRVQTKYAVFHGSQPNQEFDFRSMLRDVLEEPSIGRWIRSLDVRLSRCGANVLNLQRLEAPCWLEAMRQFSREDLQRIRCAAIDSYCIPRLIFDENQMDSGWREIRQLVLECYAKMVCGFEQTILTILLRYLPNLNVLKLCKEFESDDSMDDRLWHTLALMTWPSALRDHGFRFSLLTLTHV